MVRCAADVRSADHTGKEGEVLYKETLCPLKYLQEVWQQPRQSGERQNRANLRERFSASARRNAVEKYYDCLQCAEQCRHVTTVANNNNPSITAINNNNLKLVKSTKNNSLVAKGTMGNYRVTNSINSSSLKENAKILARLDETRVLKNTKTSNLARSTKTQPLPLTPAKKRSSLARPVRVHDSFAQPRKLLPMNYAFQTLQKASESTYEEDDYKETGWPIRLRLEQMLELTLPQTKKRPKKKTPMMLMKQQQTSRHACKDTERLLRVLSVNNVDQDTRYNVTRCSVM